ncbi:MAG: hypothetical protein JSS53_07605 [Proteobacteria bacterium]|nr:hypothetical protein [Pseudomonadota bacterium]
MIENPAKQNAAERAASTARIEAAVAEASARTTEVLEVGIVEMLEKSFITYPFKMTPWMMHRAEIMAKRVEGRKSFWDAWVVKISNQSEEISSQVKTRTETKDVISEDLISLSLRDLSGLLENKKLGDEILAIIERCDREIDEIRKNIKNIIRRKEDVKNTKPDQLEEAEARVRKKQYQAEELQARAWKEQYRIEEAQARVKKEQYQSEETQASLKKKQCQTEESQARARKEQCRVEGAQERKARLALEAESAASDSKLAAAAQSSQREAAVNNKMFDTIGNGIYDKMGFLGNNGELPVSLEKPVMTQCDSDYSLKSRV